MKVLASYNIKGGVGKTATAVNLAFLAAREGGRVLLWDLDPQGAATFYYRMNSAGPGEMEAMVEGRLSLASAVRESDYPRLDVLPSRFGHRKLDDLLSRKGKAKKRFRKMLEPLSILYDWVILDCAPSVQTVSDGVFKVADALLVPTIPTVLSLRTLKQLVDHLEDQKGASPLIFPFFSMVDRRKKMHCEIIQQSAYADVAFMRQSIPYASVVEKMGIHRQPVIDFAPNSSASLSYQRLWGEVKHQLMIQSHRQSA